MEETATERSIVEGLHFSTYGHGPPILFLHGFGSSSYTWAKIVHPLSSAHKIFAMDLKGFGASEKPEDGRYSLRDQKEAVLAFIDRYALNDLTLVGHSMGGGVALLVAMELEKRSSGRLHRLVLIDSISCPQRLPLFIRLLRLPLLGPFTLRIVPATWSVYAILRLAYYRTQKIERRTVHEYAAPLRKRAGRAALVATARQLIPPDLDSLVAQYRTLRVPVLILWRQEDRIVPLSIGTCLRNAIPTARFRSFPECGHVPQEEWPALTVSALREFITETERLAVPPR